ncbi:MAG: phytanoyl-CoA dioxygenase family protein, partial [Candidatus Poribacteria bacterium]|nr:phytanoyl-CoA dioxygenase family protein [Candidatus Poribacteria bacterium]
MVEKIQNFGLSSEQIDSYQEHGYIILNQVFTYQDCQAFVQHMEDLKSGRKSIEGFKQQNKYGYRTFNQHFYDPEVLKFLTSPLLRKPLSDCFGDDPEAIQTMHFYEGSEHERHQDQYYLPDCMSAWIAMEEVNDENGPLCLQPQSH